MTCLEKRFISSRREREKMDLKRRLEATLLAQQKQRKGEGGYAGTSEKNKRYLRGKKECVGGGGLTDNAGSKQNKKRKSIGP